MAKQTKEAIPEKPLTKADKRRAAIERLYSPVENYKPVEGTEGLVHVELVKHEIDEDGDPKFKPYICKFNVREWKTFNDPLINVGLEILKVHHLPKGAKTSEELIEEYAKRQPKN